MNFRALLPLVLHKISFFPAQRRTHFCRPLVKTYNIGIICVKNTDFLQFTFYFLQFKTTAELLDVDQTSRLFNQRRTKMILKIIDYICLIFIFLSKITICFWYLRIFFFKNVKKATKSNLI